MIGRTLAGEAAAFGFLVARHRAVVVRVSARIVGRDDAEDVAQEAFIRALDRLSRFRGEAPFRSWLLIIARNTALDVVSRRRTVPFDSEQEQGADASLADDEHDPVESFERAERRRHLRTELDALRPAYCRLIVLRDLEGRSYEETARLLQMPMGSVKNGLHRARRELVERLRASSYPGELPGANVPRRLEQAA